MTSPRSSPMIGLTWDNLTPRTVDLTHDAPGIFVAGVPTLISDVHDESTNPVVVSSNSDSDELVAVGWRSELCEGKTRVVRISERVIEFATSLTFSSTCKPNDIGWLVEATVVNPRWLDHQYRMQPATGTLLIDAWTPLLVKGQTGSTPSHFQLVGSTFFPAVTLNSQSIGNASKLSATIWLDHHHTHPRFSFTGERFWNWHNQYTFEAGQTLGANFRVVLDRDERPSVVCGRFPDRKQAMISITDHADHDTCRKVSALFFGSSIESEQQTQPQGFAGLRLPFTKTVFTKTDDTNGAGLHNPEYVEICDRAHAAGLEIGPHGIHETVEPPLAEFAELIEPFKRYSPNTWIDHGRSFHCNYRLSGWNADHEYNLEQVLGPLGIDCVWAGFDFGLAVPNRCLNQLQMRNFSGSRFLRDLPRSTWRAIRSGRPWAIAHELATIVFQMMPDRAMKQYFEMHRHMESFVWGRKLKSLLPAFRELFQLALLVAQPANLREVIRQFLGPRAELAMAPVMYREHETLADANRQRWLFNTIAVHDVEDAYSPESVEQLQSEYGFHIAHTYLASMSRAHLSHALQRHPDKTGHWQLTPKFAANLKHMAQLQSRGSLWVASVGEVCEHWERLRNVSISPEGDRKWNIELSSGEQSTQIPIVIIGDDVPSDGSPVTKLRDRTHLASINLGVCKLTAKEGTS